MNVNIAEPLHGMALFWSKAFRPFFLAAVIFSAVTMLVWLRVLFYGLTFDTGSISYFQWHAHELLFGYGGAVVAGFLLTAATNWTGINTLSGPALVFLLALWLLARVGWFVDGVGVWISTIADIVFWLLLIGAVTRPVLLAKQWRQAGILAILWVLLWAQLLFFADAIGVVQGAAYAAIYMGLFSVIGLILVMLRRIFPFFVKAASDGQVELINPSWVDRASLVLFVLLFVVVSWDVDSPAMPIAAACLGLVLLVRLLNWYHPSIWQAPLLWGLYLSLAFIVMGCWLLAWSYWSIEYRYLAVHAWSFGGFGLATISMLVRVAVGHSGGNVRQTRPWVCLAFILLVVAALLRVLVPLAMPNNLDVLLWSQFLWVLAFAICCLYLWPILRP